MPSTRHAQSGTPFSGWQVSFFLIRYPLGVWVRKDDERAIGCKQEKKSPAIALHAVGVYKPSYLLFTQTPHKPHAHLQQHICLCRLSVFSSLRTIRLRTGSVYFDRVARVAWRTAWRLLKAHSSNSVRLPSTPRSKPAPTAAKVLALPGMKVDLLLHDDACHFEQYVKKNYPDVFSDIKYYVVDFHALNQTCSKRYWTGAVKRRCQNVRTNITEIFNAWIRSLNFFFNSLRPHSHKFWVAEACRFYNENLKDVAVHIGRRTNVAARQRRGKAHKKPAAARK